MRLCKPVDIILITVSLTMACGLAVGCEPSPSISITESKTTLPVSEYPADISGYVTIAEKVEVELPKSNKKIEYAGGPWWVVGVSVKNNNYGNPITSIWDLSISMPVGQEHWIWSIVIDRKVWSGIKYDEITGIFTPLPMRVLKGQSGKITFLFNAPNVSPSDAEICYRGQEPYSYGKLTFGDKVAAYDWDLKEAVPEPRHVPVSPPAEYEGPRPHGLYSASFLGFEERLEFEGDKLTRADPAFGKFVYLWRSCKKVEGLRIEAELAML